MDPRAPFHKWPLQETHEEFGYAWLAAPCVLVDQVTVSHATLAVVRWLDRTVNRVVEQNYDFILSQGGLVLIHDWRQIESYDSKARAEYMANIKNRKKGYSKATYVAVRRNASPLLRMAVEGSNLVARLSHSMPVTLVHDPNRALIEHGIERPLRPLAFPKFPTD